MAGVLSPQPPVGDPGPLSIAMARGGQKEKRDGAGASRVYTVRRDVEE
jgi:hypothetical protein